jgi:hypothetical protein
VAIFLLALTYSSERTYRAKKLAVRVCFLNMRLMETKLSSVKNYMQNGLWQEAIRVAAKFPRLGAQRDAILSAHMAYTNPRFVVQLKKNVEALKADGRNALIARFGLE